MSTNDILILPPFSYTKRSLSSFDLKEYDKFIEVFEKKLKNEWDIKYKILSKSNDSIYKVSFKRFQQKILLTEKPYIIIFVVVSNSDNCFNKTIEKLRETCDELDQLKRFLTISLDTKQYQILEDSGIDLNFFGDYIWKVEDSHQWNAFHNDIKNKLDQFRDGFASSMLFAESGPTGIPSASSSVRLSRMKSFFNSLPTKFDKSHRQSLRRIFHHDKAPMQSESNEQNTSKCKTLDRELTNNSTTQDHSKLTLNSLFRRRSHRKSQKELSDNNNNHLTLENSTLDKSPRFRAKVVNFKSKTGRALNSTKSVLGCLQSPDTNKKKKPKTKVKMAMNEMVQFSTKVMTASSAINRSQSDPRDRRGRSEPIEELDLCQSRVNTRADEEDDEDESMIKYYSWSSQLDDVSYEILKNDAQEEFTIPFNQIPSVQIDESETERCLKSLEDMIISIEASCTDLKGKSTSLTTRNSSTTADSQEESRPASTTPVESSIIARREVQPLHQMQYISRPVSMDRFIGQNAFLLHQLTNTGRARSCSPSPRHQSRHATGFSYAILHHPASVTCLMALTTYTAPQWSSLISSTTAIDQLGRVVINSLYNLQQNVDKAIVLDIVQSLPNTIVSCAKQGSIITANRLFELLERSNQYLLSRFAP